MEDQTLVISLSSNPPLLFFLQPLIHLRTDIAAFTNGMEMASLESYCSWCYEKTNHTLVTRRFHARNTYKCEGCGNNTLECRICSNMSKSTENWDDELCAEHDCSIIDFESTFKKIDDIIFFPSTEEREKLNIRYKNLFFNKKSFANKMANLSMGDVGFDNFRISHVSGFKSDSSCIYINGFTQEKDGFEDWVESHDYFKGDPLAYGLNWNSSSYEKMAIDFVFEILPAVSNLSKFFKFFNFYLIKRWSFSNIVLMAPKAIVSILDNPWYRSMWEAEKAGYLLAEAIRRSPNDNIRLVGHSLGCRVIYYALRSLSNQGVKKVDDVILLGGAVGNKPEEWGKCLNSINGKIYNCYSKNDHVLRGLYRYGNLLFSSPIGYSEIGYHDENKIKNEDFTDIVSGHDKWKSEFNNILNRIYDDDLFSRDLLNKEVPQCRDLKVNDGSYTPNFILLDSND